MARSRSRRALRCGWRRPTRPGAARGVVDSAYDLAGGSSLYESGPLARRFRDAHAAGQHMLVAPATWELTGRLLLGAPADVTQL